MFKNHALQVRMVRSTKPQNAPDKVVTYNHLDPEQISKIAKDQVKHAAIAVGAVLAASKLLNTVSEIVIITAKAKIR
jgi:uncharacterized protein YaiL (DUF2058 family)